MESILDSVKEYCGLLADDTTFDNDITMALNSVLVMLPQLGVGPDTPFVVEDNSSTWADLLGEDPTGAVAMYVSMRTRMMFDPPTGTYVKQALDETIKELEWRIIAEVDKKDYEAREV